MGKDLVELHNRIWQVFQSYIEGIQPDSVMDLTEHQQFLREVNQMYTKLFYELHARHEGLESHIEAGWALTLERVNEKAEKLRPQ